MTAPANSDGVARIIFLVRGLMEDGTGFYWCYVAVKPSRHQEFKKALDNKYNIQNFVDDGYGEVIVSGAGDVPPGEITAQVAELFGVSAQSFFKDRDPDATLAEKLKASGEQA